MICSLRDLLALVIVTFGIAPQGLVAAPLLFLIEPLYIPLSLLIPGTLLPISLFGASRVLAQGIRLP